MSPKMKRLAAAPTKTTVGRARGSHNAPSPPKADLHHNLATTIPRILAAGIHHFHAAASDHRRHRLQSRHRRIHNRHRHFRHLHLRVIGRPLLLPPMSFSIKYSPAIAS